MKILFIHNRYQYRGGEDTTLEMESALLLSKGHEVKILEFNNDQLSSIFSKITGGLRAVYNSQSASIVEKEISNYNPDIIHVHNLFFTASPSVLYKARQMKIPVVMTVQNYRLMCANALLLRDQQICELCINKVLPLAGVKYKCYRSSYIESALVTGITGIHKLLSSWEKKVNTYIVPSEFLKNKLNNTFLKLPKSKVVVKPNFVKDIPAEKTNREDFFLFIGRLSTEKGITTLLKCFTTTPSLKLVIAGDGPDKDTVLSYTRTASNITYLGQQPKEKVLELMRKCKALLFPSIWYEGLPLTIIEAFATGTPVIASNLGAMTEMIQNEYNGFYFSPGNVDELRNKILYLADNVERYEHLYSNARATYLKKYHPDVHYTSIMRIYQMAITDNYSSHV